VSLIVAIEEIYPDLQDLFVRRLHVPTANAVVLMLDLESLSLTRGADIQKVKDIMLEVGRLLTRDEKMSDIPDAIDSLKSKKFLPVRFPGAEITLCGTEDGFWIVDHTRYAKALEDKIPLLNFDHEEERVLNSFLRLLGLSRWYLSRAVEEVSFIPEGATEDSALTVDFKRRAYAISW